MSALNRVTLAHLAARDAAPVIGSYICDDGYEDACPCRPDPRAGWGICYHESTRRRLEWQGGPSEGAKADLAAWNSLGSRA